MFVAATTGSASLLGIAAVVTAGALIVMIFATFMLASTAVSRREIDDARARTAFPIAVPRGGDPTRARRGEPPS